MASQLRFDNRVAIVTGAGAGLGRAYALELAKRGAKVLVNDLGVTRAGEETSSRAADQVVQEIRAAGGEALGNYDSVEFGSKIVEAAVKAFGRVDIIINNAGILRDVSMLKMTSKDWDLIMTVHLKGAFSLSKAAWPYMRKNGFGRIINTSSSSGIYGNFGQANYATGKLGLFGMTQTLAKEGDKYNIKVNAIAPSAASRMTEDVMSKEILSLLTPEKVVPLVMFLCHEKNQENGGLFEVAGGFIARLRWQRAQGSFFSGEFTPEDVVEKWAEVTGFDRVNDYPLAMTDTLQTAMNLIEKFKPKL
jgi:NAD(P)-dependent dehydrogenase (short-subunit alcohol dehydrogenase family)